MTKAQLQEYPRLCDRSTMIFSFSKLNERQSQGIKYSTYKTEEVGHGREEIRNYLMLSDIQRRLDPDAVWSKMNSVGMVESVRSLDGKTTVETCYFISSLEQNVEQFANTVRSYWGIENS
ncbi:ISAs1 family transposase [Nostoc sp.]|uniref:ISAs1 family transposase n=1 Tax=Nostoc sp. TaxID=1180 RepID=UPI003FA58EA3